MNGVRPRGARLCCIRGEPLSRIITFYCVKGSLGNFVRPSSALHFARIRRCEETHLSAATAAWLGYGNVSFEKRGKSLSVSMNGENDEKGLEPGP